MTNFIIQTNSDAPIYRQLVEQVRRMAASGLLVAGQRLPSVRQLAQDLAVNPMTVSKAYSLLEQDGLLERQRGVGMVLRADTNSREELIRPALDELARQAKQLGFSKTSISKMLSISWEENFDD